MVPLVVQAEFVVVVTGYPEPGFAPQSRVGDVVLGGDAQFPECLLGGGESHDFDGCYIGPARWAPAVAGAVPASSLSVLASAVEPKVMSASTAGVVSQ